VTCKIIVSILLKNIYPWVSPGTGFIEKTISTTPKRPIVEILNHFQKAVFI
jgi:hypothetical protein